MSIQPLDLGDGVIIYVEAETEHLPPIINSNTDLPSDLPPGAEPTGIGSTVLNTAKILKDTISGTAKSVFESLSSMSPDEWSVEINIGFKAENLQMIPVLITGEGEGSLKVTATWKKNP